MLGSYPRKERRQLLGFTGTELRGVTGMAVHPGELSRDPVDLPVPQARNVIHRQGAWQIDHALRAHEHLHDRVGLRIGQGAHRGVAGGRVVVVEFQRVAGGGEPVVDRVLDIASTNL